MKARLKLFLVRLLIIGIVTTPLQQNLLADSGHQSMDSDCATLPLEVPEIVTGFASESDCPEHYCPQQAGCQAHHGFDPLSGKPPLPSSHHNPFRSRLALHSVTFATRYPALPQRPPSRTALS